MLPNGRHRFRIKNLTGYHSTQLRQLWNYMIYNYAPPQWTKNLALSYTLTITTRSGPSNPSHATVNWAGTNLHLSLPRHLVRTFYVAAAFYYFATRGQVWVGDESSPVALSWAPILDRVGHILFEYPSRAQRQRSRHKPDDDPPIPS